ncbi:mannitol-1-phosphate 5-dehydrogenase [Spiroplasma corruscae]|uniref:Mannitol-1-phosphate 5-dehydrogenase n=1 Tax=Spiroplasma corruscae TaxID=216934 RepID=A0A222EQ53_9MOLU|nr:hypothetical protein [Spiroplasma corruscae]ASP28491.1 mannitol-1-phosphate 5-dehydrogenase [Spiroplasma corruscae]
MKILHYGAGNIGRGFIAPILFDSNKVTEFYFADTNQELINKLNNESSYEVIELSEVNKSKIVNGYKAILVSEIKEKINLSDIDIITTSIGSNNLKYIKEDIINFIKEKEKDNKTLIIMCCENGEKVSSSFEKDISKEYLFNKEMIKFVDVMVDRIVPNDTSNELNIKVEPYFSWVADENNWPKQVEKLSTINYTKNIDAEICKKVWMLNGSHAALAWKEWKRNKFSKKIINVALNDSNDKTLLDFLKNYLLEMSQIVEVAFNYNRKELDKFIESVISRFTNIYIKDDFERVARNTIKKLQLDERILKPYLISVKNNLDCKNIKETILNGITYNNEKDDDGLIISNLLKNNSSNDLILKTLIKGISDDIINAINN